MSVSPRIGDHNLRSFLSTETLASTGDLPQKTC